jgi:TolB protein
MPALAILSRAAFPALVLLASAALAHAQAAPLGDLDGHGDVGSPKIAGRAAYDAEAQRYTLSSAGVNMWGPRDELHFAWKRLSGDFILQARLRFEGQGTDPHRKAGVIARASLDDDAPYADVAVHGDGLTSLQFRRTKGAATEEAKSTLTGAEVVQLERKGTTFTMSVAKHGELYTTTEVKDLALGEDVYVGIFVCSHNPEVVETAVFDNVRVVAPAPDSLVPYRDYLGSRLEILDVASGARRVVHASDEQPFEAPNWTKDGRFLIYNNSGKTPDSGRLVRFELATGKGAFVDTGARVRNNNDHVISFDGTMLGISDGSDGGQSSVYTVPLAGGTPKRITKLVPSYFHGWSPDGKFLVYTGGRGGEFDVFRIASDGSGDEVNLTKSKGLDDGPEYSPDGKWIYFNSVRSGTMQIWRMRPDGSSPEQVTSDGLNNWFPHVSPDGKQIAFISFPKDVPPSDHPYYKRVYLRLMPAEGGAPTVIAYVYGGQGTINVPSWSPDGRRLAFVSNSGRLR